MTEIGLFSTNLSNTAPSIGGLLEDKIEEGLSYTISPHLYTTAPRAHRIPVYPIAAPAKFEAEQPSESTD
jgi:hypothetical protein